MSVRISICLLSLIPGEFPEVPAKPARPVDEIQVTDADQSAFVAVVAAPFAALYADETVVRAFFFLDDSMRISERGPEGWLEGGAVREISRGFVNDKALGLVP